MKAVLRASSAYVGRAAALQNVCGSLRGKTSVLFSLIPWLPAPGVSVLLAVEVTVLLRSLRESRRQQHLPSTTLVWKPLASPPAGSFLAWACARHQAVDLNHSPSFIFTSKQVTSRCSLRALPSPREPLARSEDIWGCYSWQGRWYYWHLVGKSQGCC